MDVMRSMLLRLVSFLCVAFLPVAAGAVNVPFLGTLSVEISNLPPIVIQNTGVAIVNLTSGGGIGSVSLAGGTFAAPISVPVTDPAAIPIGGVLVNASNGAASFGLGGKMPLKGTAVVCLFAACNGEVLGNINVPFTLGGTRGIGLGGPAITAMGLVSVTVQGAPWQLGTVMAGDGTRMGFFHGPASGGSETAFDGHSVLQLVTPIVVNTNIGASRTLPAFATLKLDLPYPFDDADTDGVIDFFDNCDAVQNPDQADTDGNGLGDACNQAEDRDGDEIADALDTCPDAPNATTQHLDTDGDGLPDACDPFPNAADNEKEQLKVDLAAAKAERDAIRGQRDAAIGERDQCLTAKSGCEGDLFACGTSKTQCLASLDAAQSSLSICQLDLSECSADLAIRSSERDSCFSELQGQSAQLIACDQSLADATSSLEDAQLALAAAEGERDAALAQVATLQAQIAALQARDAIPACRADLNADGVVNFVDLARMKAVFFKPCTPP